jgi:hypothetical protein
VLLTAVLGINQYCDLKHQQTFVQAAADPIADRLGPDWKTAFIITEPHQTPSSAPWHTLGMGEGAKPADF